METEELPSVNVSPLVTDSFAVQWSPDNQISIITERGVHIFVSTRFDGEETYRIGQPKRGEERTVNLNLTCNRLCNDTSFTL